VWLKNMHTGMLQRQRCARDTHTHTQRERERGRDARHRANTHRHGRVHMHTQTKRGGERERERELKRFLFALHNPKAEDMTSLARPVSPLGVFRKAGLRRTSNYLYTSPQRRKSSTLYTRSTPGVPPVDAGADLPFASWRPCM
jgi:hypothetical protein